jgi:hypothetical protein
VQDKLDKLSLHEIEEDDDDDDEPTPPKVAEASQGEAAPEGEAAAPTEASAPAPKAEGHEVIVLVDYTAEELEEMDVEALKYEVAVLEGASRAGISGSGAERLDQSASTRRSQTWRSLRNTAGGSKNGRPERKRLKRSQASAMRRRSATRTFASNASRSSWLVSVRSV